MIHLGDLICYNAGSSKRSTLGLVLDKHTLRHNDYRLQKKSTHSVLVQWCLIGPVMPRFYRKLNDTNFCDVAAVQAPSPGAGDGWVYNGKIGVGDCCWHELGDWFEPVGEVEE